MVSHSNDTVNLTVLRTTALNPAADRPFLQDADRRMASVLERIQRAEELAVLEHCCEQLDNLKMNCTAVVYCIYQ